MPPPPRTSAVLTAMPPPGSAVASSGACSWDCAGGATRAAASGRRPLAQCCPAPQEQRRGAQRSALRQRSVPARPPAHARPCSPAVAPATTPTRPTSPGRPRRRGMPPSCAVFRLRSCLTGRERGVLRFASVKKNHRLSKVNRAVAGPPAASANAIRAAARRPGGVEGPQKRNSCVRGRPAPCRRAARSGGSSGGGGGGAGACLAMPAGVRTEGRGRPLLPPGAARAAAPAGGLARVERERGPRAGS
jgi:hypothetical protein